MQLETISGKDLISLIRCIDREDWVAETASKKFLSGAYYRAAEFIVKLTKNCINPILQFRHI